MVFRRRGFVATTVLLGAAILAFYTWTAVTSGYSLSTHSYPWEDRYNALADAFSRGQLNLPAPVPEGLKHLRDPYDPVANAKYRGDLPYPLHDLEYYNGKLYPAFGPVPALAVFLPWHALGLGWFPDPLAVVLFMSLGFLAGVALMLWLIRRFAPEAPLWTRWAAVLAMGLCTVAPYALRRPLPYDTAQGCGLLIAMLALLALASGVLGERVRRGLLALGSLAVGLEAGTRPDLLALGLLLPMAWWWAGRADAGRDRRARGLDAAALAGPLLACLVAVGLYNHARYGAFGEFGDSYLLTSIPLDSGKRAVNIAPGVFFYLLAPLHLDGVFPFFHVERPTDAIYPGTLPGPALVLERTSGIVPTQPFVLWALALPALIARRRLPAQLAGALLGIVAVAGIVLVFAAYYVPGSQQRYEIDFLPLLLVCALVCWIRVLTGVRGPLARRSVGVAGGALIGFGALVGAFTALSGSDDKLALTHPGTFKHLGDFFSFLAPFTDRYGWSSTVGELLRLLAVAAAVTVIGVVVRGLAPRSGLGPRGRRARRWGQGLVGGGAASVVLALAAASLGLAPDGGVNAAQQLLLFGGLAAMVAGAFLRPALTRSARQDRPHGAGQVGGVPVGLRGP